MHIHVHVYDYHHYYYVYIYIYICICTYIYIYIYIYVYMYKKALLKRSFVLTKPLILRIGASKVLPIYVHIKRRVSRGAGQSAGPAHA